MSTKGRINTVYIKQDDIATYSAQIYGDMFKKIAGNGVYLSGNSDFFTMSTFDFYSNIRLVSSANPPFDGAPINDYVIYNPNSVEISFPKNLPIGDYSIIFCNQAGYTTTAKNNKLPQIRILNPNPIPSQTPSRTVTPSVTPSSTVTPSTTPTITITPSVTPSSTVTPSTTPTITITPSVPPTLTITPTVTPSETPPITPSGTVSITPTVTPSGTVSITPTVTPTGTSSPYMFDVTNSGSGYYIINGQQNPTLTITEGKTYIFNINASGHPFWINSVFGTGTGNTYNNGVTNNGTDNGVITFVVPYDATLTLYYNCQFHESMGGVINVINVPVTPTVTPSITPDIASQVGTIYKYNF